MRRVKINEKQFGDGQRLLHQELELENAPIIPSPVEYEDIDNAVFNYFNEKINITDDNGEKVPMFRLLSNQRFTEYSQTWQHTDKDGNLLMNFKTINREINPSWGTIHDGNANIPGSNRFTLLIREVLDKNGVECYEVTSMSQPLSVDIKYTITFVTSKLDRINEFNLKIIDLFKEKECYVFPNNHAMPMMLDTIGDESVYDIDGRKFYNQPVSINLLAYIIPKDDIKVDLKPKKASIDFGIDKFKKTYVDMDIDENDEKKFNLNVKFKPGITKTQFTIDELAIIKLENKENANRVTIKIDDEEYKPTEKIRIEPNSEIKISIIQPEYKVSTLNFTGNLI